MSYSEVSFFINQKYHSLLITELDVLGYDSFLEDTNVLVAYILSDQLDIEAVKALQQRLQGELDFTFEAKEMEDKNWNEEWEKNYDPVRIDDQVYIRAHFHPKDDRVKHEILITPQMSFGTGHHATTALVVRSQLKLDFNNKTVLDAGCGTGVLAIMAGLLGATSIDAYDIDEWAYNNAKENFVNNNFEDIRLLLGDIRVVEELNRKYDVILANINKNVLLQDVPAYAQLLSENGYLVLSGFYEKDVPDLQQLAGKLQLKLFHQESKDDWTCLVYIKTKA